MNKELNFDAWAPVSARWSRWVKPVLFACMEREPPAHLCVPEPVDLSWTPSAADGVVLVLDLPGASGVHAGLELARRGYRPVPLYNAIPASPGYPIGDELVDTTPMLIDVAPIVAALWHGSESLRQLGLSSDAPPAFLLDWNRSSSTRHVRPGLFDNRSVSFTTDFPSANFLQAHGLQRVVLVQPSEDQPRADLAHTLRRWQQAGLAMALKRLDTAGSPGPCNVRQPSWFGWAWQRVLMAAGLRRAKAGGFGAWVPMPSSG